MKAIVTCILFSLFSTAVFAQLKGSGKILNQTFDYTSFYQLNFKDLDGRIEVTIGSRFSIEVSIDDNLAPLLQVSLNKANNELTVKLLNNENNRKYIENTQIRIKITLPILTKVNHEGNSVLYITGISGTFINLSNGGNGNVIAKGATDSLNVSNRGNGNVNVSELVANKVTVINRGNGNSNVFAQFFLEGKVSGNGSIKNHGKAPFSSGSKKSGNGRLIAVNATSL